MNTLKLIMIFLILILSSCAQKFQNNGHSERKIENFDIKVGKTSKKYLIDNYGPPFFESVFNNNIIYYISHNTSYKTFDERKTENLIVLEITLDNKNIVNKIKNYSNKDGFPIKVSSFEDDQDFNFTGFWKNIVRALRRTNTDN